MDGGGEEGSDDEGSNNYLAVMGRQMFYGASSSAFPTGRGAPFPPPRVAGEEVYWVGPAGPEQDAGRGTDFHAVRHGFVSVTPLQIDLTRHAQIHVIDAWLGQAAT